MVGSPGRLGIKRANPKLPWIAHFSDPWVDGPYAAELHPVTRRKWRDNERRVMETADALIFVNEPTASLVMQKYPPSLRNVNSYCTACF